MHQDYTLCLLCLINGHEQLPCGHIDLDIATRMVLRQWCGQMRASMVVYK